MPEAPFYFTGGTVPRDASCYVTREADERLFRALRAGEFCYVLTARQMGKSSLMTRVAQRLREEGVAVAVLDLTAFGRNISAEQWYDQLLARIGRELRLEDELDDFWLENERLPPLTRFLTALTDLVLKLKPGDVVLFVDEIDIVRSLNFDTDELFAAIRELFNRRVDQPDLRRLTFCLLGVASPSDLIKDPRITPFNTGTRIELTDFSENEASPLAEGFGASPELSHSALKRVLHWTGGHPYLTQRLCRIAAESKALSNSAVDAACREHFLDPQAQGAEDNLRFVGDRLLRATDDKHTVLGRFREVLHGKKVALDETDPVQEVLRLSGIVRVENGRLKIRNRIYERVFDGAWIERNTETAEKRRQEAAFRRGLNRAIGIASAVGTVLVALSAVALNQARLAESREVRALNLAYVANMNLIQREWEASPPNIARVRDLLAEMRDSPHRGWEWDYWSRRCNLSLLTLSGHHGLLNHVAYSPDGTKIVTTSDDYSARIWDAASGEQLAEMRVSEAAVQSAAFAPTGALLTGSMDGKIRVWPASDYKKSREFAAHPGGVRSVAVSPDGRQLLTAGVDRTAKVWDLATFRLLHTLAGHSDIVEDARFSRDGRLIGTASGDGTARVWDAATGAQKNRLGGYGGKLPALVFLPNAKRLVAASDDTLVRVWDLPAGTETLLLRQHQEPVRSLDVSPDGRHIAAGGDDGFVTMWDVSTAMPDFRLLGHEWFISGVAFSPDGTRLATASWDDTARVWDAQQSRESLILRAEGPVTAVACSPDSRQVVTGDNDGIVRLWDASTGTKGAPFARHNSPISALRFLPSGRVATAGEDGVAWLWKPDTGDAAGPISPKSGAVRDLDASRDGSRLLLGIEDGTARIWDAEGKSEQLRIKAGAGPVDAVAFHPEGRRFATAVRDGPVSMWNGGKHEWRSSEKSLQTRTLAFSPDGSRLAEGSGDRSVTIRDAATGKELHHLKGHQYEVTVVAWSPDGRRLLSGSLDNTLKLWDPAIGREVLTLRGLYEVRSAAFSPDGRSIIGGGAEGAAHVWSIAR